MKVNMQAIGFTIGESLEDYINEKIGKVSNLYDQIIAVNVVLKMENTSEKEDKIIEIRLEIPGDDIFVSQKGEAYPEAIDLATDTLKRLIIKRKEKSSKV